jgi:hypothetical protein
MESSAFLFPASSACARSLLLPGTCDPTRGRTAASDSAAPLCPEGSHHSRILNRPFSGPRRVRGLPDGITAMAQTCIRPKLSFPASAWHPFYSSPTPHSHKGRPSSGYHAVLHFDCQSVRLDREFRTYAPHNARLPPLSPVSNHSDMRSDDIKSLACCWVAKESVIPAT